MPTIAEIEQSLMDAANAGDMNAITSIVTSLTVAEKGQINPSVFGFTLSAVAMYSMTDPALAASTAATFMQEAGIYTDILAINQAFGAFGMFGNLAGVNAMVDNTDPQLYGALDSMVLGMVFQGIGMAVFSDPEGAVSTTANFLSHFSLYIDPMVIIGSMQNFAMFGVLDGVNAVIDNIDPQVYPFFPSFALGQVLGNLNFAIFADPDGTVETVANFLSHFSLYTDPFAITAIMQNFTMFGMLNGVNAVIDSIDPQVYSSLDPFSLGQTLNALTFNIFSDPEGVLEAVANFLSHLSLYVDPNAITFMMQNFAFSGLLDGVNVVIDNIDPQVYSSLDPYLLGQALNAISMFIFSDPEGVVDTTANFLSHLSLYTDPNSIIGAMSGFAQGGVLDGVNAVIDNTDPLVYSSFDPFFLGIAFSNIANTTFVLDDHDVAGTLRNFSESLLSQTSDFWIEQSLQSLVNNGNLSAVGGVLDYLSATQWDSLSSSFKDSLPGFGVTVGTYLDDKFVGAGGTEKYFGLGGNDNIDGRGGDDAIFGNAGDDKIAGGDGNDFLDGGIGADVLTGGAGSDTFALNNYNGVDKIQDFDKAPGGDILDFRDMLSDYDGILPVTDFILAHTAGINTFISFDADGAGLGFAIDVAKLQGVTGVDIQTLFDNGQILV